MDLTSWARLKPGPPNATCVERVRSMPTHWPMANGDKVRDAARPKQESKKDWELTAEAFRQLLEWLDAGEDSGGEKYLEMRRRLVSFFDRKNCLAPEELADETLN